MNLNTITKEDALTLNDAEDAAEIYAVMKIGKTNLFIRKDERFDENDPVFKGAKMVPYHTLLELIERSFDMGCDLIINLPEPTNGE